MKLLAILVLSVTLPACSAATSATVPPNGQVPVQYAEVPAPDDAGITVPRVVKRVEPLPPPGFIGSGRSSVAGIGVLIGPDGRVKDTWFVSGDTAWAQAAAAAIREWEFQPAMKDGAPIAIRTVITVTFRSGTVRP